MTFVCDEQYRKTENETNMIVTFYIVLSSGFMNWVQQVHSHPLTIQALNYASDNKVYSKVYTINKYKCIDMCVGEIVQQEMGFL